MSDRKSIRISQHADNSRLKELQTELERYQERYEHQFNKLERLQKVASQLITDNQGISKASLITFKKLDLQNLSQQNHS